ncbi:hypothetical protein Pelo_17335 [Pelomyxa schiedti]|nr:hypothetical protein Pelo_17335 [Pelomyxa schiedti]
MSRWFAVSFRKLFVLVFVCGVLMGIVNLALPIIREPRCGGMCTVHHLPPLPAPPNDGILKSRVHELMFSPGAEMQLHEQENPHPQHFKVSRRVFPELNSTVCITALSCKRRQLLEQSLESVIYHMENFEPRSLRYQIVVTDNSGDIPQTYDLATQFPIEKIATFAENLGQGYGFNMAYFSLCRWSKYILSIEDDWLWEKAFNFSVIADAIDVMETDHRVSTVNLRNRVFWRGENKTTPNGVSYNYWMQSKSWGPYTAGSLLHYDRVLSGGLWEETKTVFHGGGGKSAESNFALRLRNKGFKGAELTFPDGRTIHPLSHLANKNHAPCSKARLQEVYLGLPNTRPDCHTIPEEWLD